MTYLVKKSTLLIILGLITGCMAAPKEQFNESFFTYQDDDGKKYFSFILKLKGAANLQERVVFERVAGRRSGNGTKGNNRSVQQEMPAPENPEDARVSIKFRMEEMAHKKLTAKLDATNYCENKVKFEQEEYKNFQYKIKGYCKA